MTFDTSPQSERASQQQEDKAPMGLPVFHKDMCAEDMDKMAASAMQASNFLKAISHEGRLMILCHLASGEKSVTELSLIHI